MLPNLRTDRICLTKKFKLFQEAISTKRKLTKLVKLSYIYLYNIEASWMKEHQDQSIWSFLKISPEIWFYVITIWL